jgi:hypothetical protein
MYPETIRFRDTRHRKMVQGKRSKHERFVATSTSTICMEDNRLQTNVHFKGSDIYPVKQYFEHVLLRNSKFSSDIA